MATIKLIQFKGKKLKDNKFSIMLRVSKTGHRTHISIGYACTEDQWMVDEEYGGRFRRSYPNSMLKNKAIMKQYWRAEKIIAEFEAEDIEWTIEQFKRSFSGIKPQNVYEAFDAQIKELYEVGRIGYAKSFIGTKNKLQKYTKTKVLRFSTIDYNFLKKYEHYLRKAGLIDNTISVHMRSIRKIFNKAIKEKQTKPQYYPFKEYKISDLDHSTRKRAIPIEDIKKMFAYQPDPETKQQLTMHILNFSFFMMGMNYNDIVKLKWSDIDKERIRYKRSKTAKEISVKMSPQVVKIVAFYKAYNPNNPYIFPVLNETHDTPVKIQARCKSGLKTLNKHLKIIAKAKGIESHLTSYILRHSWATIMKTKGVQTAIISEALGHSSERVTQIYLDSFSNETLDNANELLWEDF